MTCGFTQCVDDSSKGQRRPRAVWPGVSGVAAAFVVIACLSLPPRAAHADPMARATAAYARGDYVRAVNILTPLALRGNAAAEAYLGFMFENGYGVRQADGSAADLYIQAAIRGNAFGQAMLGLSYDKGHGVPQDFVLAYKWLDLAAARAPKRERDYFLRLRNAVAFKMTPAQIAEGQRLAMLWAVGLR